MHALAQSSTAAPGATQTPPIEQPSEAKLDAFANAVVSVNEVAQKWQPRVAEAKEPAEAQKMQTQARDEIAEAVRNEGLTFEEYNSIYQLAESNPDINQAVRRLIREKAKQ
jgi:hypothetical protein